MNGNKVPKWVFIIVVGIAMTLFSILWANTVNSLNTTDMELKSKFDVVKDFTIELKLNIAEINGRLANIEKALGIFNSAKK